MKVTFILNYLFLCVCSSVSASVLRVLERVRVCLRVSVYCT